MKNWVTYGLLILLILGVGKLTAQVSPLTRIQKLPLKHAYVLEDSCKLPLKRQNRKLKTHWIVYSDRDSNLTYVDPHGREERTTVDLIQPLLVIRTKNGFCKVLKYDAELIPDGNGMLWGLIPSRRKSFRLANRKKAEYLGWIPEDRLIKSENPIVCGHTMKPAKYYTALCSPVIVKERDQHLKKDSVYLFKAPGLRQKKGELILLQDWVYVYKKNRKPAQYLVGTVPQLNPDSSEGSWGWVTDSMLLPEAQTHVLSPNHRQLASEATGEGESGDFVVHWIDEKHANSEADTSRLVIDEFMINAAGERENWFLPSFEHLSPTLDSSKKTIKTFIPLDLIDISKTKVYNYLGQTISHPEFLELQKKRKQINLVLVFEDGKLGKENLRTQINSMQALAEMISHPKYEEYTFNFAAAGYRGRWLSDTLQLTPSFPGWLAFMEKRAEDTIKWVDPNHVMIRGLLEASRYLEGHEEEHNVVVVLGSRINADAFPKMLPNVISGLSAASASLVFIQSETGPAKYYSDFLLQAKHISKAVGDGTSQNRKAFIVDNSMITTTNELVPFLGQGEGSLYDFPNNSMYKGGIFFPRSKQPITPTLLEAIMDTLLDQIDRDNHRILNGLSNKFTISQSLYYHPNPMVDKILRDQGVGGMPDSIFYPYSDQFYVEVRESYRLEEGKANEYEPAFLLSQLEFKGLLKNLRKCVLNPRIDGEGESQVTMDDRKYWSKESIHNYKELNKVFRFKAKAGKVPLAQLIFMHTGLPVNNQFFRDRSLHDIRKKAKVKQQDLLPQIEYFHRDIFEVERYPSTHPESVVRRGNNVYFIIPASILP